MQEISRRELNGRQYPGRIIMIVQNKHRCQHENLRFQRVFMDFLSLGYWLFPIGFVLIGILCFWRWVRSYHPQAQLQRARPLFQEERPRLEESFFQAAAASGKPRGLRWKECHWDNLIEWACDRQTGQLLALVGITIAFEAIEGGDMEGLAAVGNLRNASAVFFFQDGRWQTIGHTIFNLNPDEVVQRYHQGYERLI
jgi:hypothetical protein